MSQQHTPAEKSEPRAATPPSQIAWNPISFATVSWIYPLLQTGYKKPLVEDDLPLLSDKEQAINLTHWLNRYTEQGNDVDVAAGRKKPKLSLVNALLPHVLPIVIVDAVCQLISVAMTTLLSLQIEQVLNFVNKDYPRELLFIDNGYALAFLMLGMQILYTLSTTVSESIGLVLQIRVKAALINSIYKKSLNLSSKSRKEFPPGKINSMVGSDTTSVMGFIESFNKVWSMPLQVGISLYFVSKYLGVATATAGGVFLGLGILSAALSAPLGTAFKLYMTTLDKRTTVLREFLYGVKVVKYHALEETAGSKIQKAREEQVKALYKIVLGFVLLIGVIILQNGLTSPLTFITYSALGNAMRPEVIFPSLSFLSSLMNVSGMLPQIVFAVMQSLVSYKRLSLFLLAEESNSDDFPQAKTAVESVDGHAITLENASFTWEKVDAKSDDDAGQKKKEKPKGKKNKRKTVPESIELDPKEEVPEKDVFTLNDISVSIKKGSLVAVVGATGSGKSSLLSAITGGMRKTGGLATVYGSVAYCAQEPWIISGTIEENITLLDETVVESCESAIAACSLTKDLNSFPSGIKTQIGEKGINLSGGQKARVALARAIAKNSDVYVLDDPLSALDSHVSKDIFDGAIKGPLMQEKTVILATHLLHVLPNVDQVIVMDQGAIVQNGSFSSLMEDVDGALFRIMKDYHLDEIDEDAEKSVKKQHVELNASKEEDVQAEDRETGAVSAQTYKSYARAIGFKWLSVEALCFISLTTVYVVQQLTLSAWTTNYWNFSDPLTYLYLYCGLSVVVSFVDVMNVSLTLYVCVRGAQYFHDSALAGLLRAPMSFFDSQPIGRILNRMTADVRSLDNGTGMIFSNLIASLYLALGILIITCISSWHVIPICIALVASVYFIFKFFKNSYRELRRLVSIMQSPLTAHVSETLTGIPTILAYGSQEVFVAKQIVTLDQSNLAMLLFNNTMFWVTMRLNILGGLITFAVAMLGVSGVMPAGLVGIALTQITYFAPVINGVLLLTANLEANMVAVERLNHYAHKLPSEAARTLPKDATLNSWPSSGSIAVNKLKLVYESRPDHTVVNGITLCIKGGEKIGVVGRTGSGKSTLMDAFFRLIEAAGGSIEIDGQDISTVGLKKLRSSIQMIPQNPTLFDGTIRSNIDALAKYGDDEIWYALECVGMKDYVSGLTDKLDSPVTEGGTNLSAGQRQLLCLAKVLLEKSKILIMDEATSSVDAESDLRIQDSMKTHFKNATVLSVAHRLNTIAAFDKVLVLENGNIAEFDSPYVLLSTAGSVFAEMVNATGVANAAVILDIAKQHYESNLE
ncbi:P-loop containing nucleoside triphosphate hydrolase protein [Obelidium mucronatum]|nr:P-loop containing nucleoside triphosphate hydrolase protein [Obelidium mucronatum]